MTGPEDRPAVLLERQSPHPALSRNLALGRASQIAATASLRFLLVLAALIVLGTLIGMVWFVVLPILLALLLTTVLWPPVRWLRDRGCPPALAATTAIIGTLGVLAAIVGVLAPQVTGQAQELADKVVSGLEDLQERLARPPFNFDDQAVSQAIDRLVDQARNNADDLASQIVNGVGIVGNVLLEALLALVLTFFFLKDGLRLMPWLCQLTGPKAAPHVTELAERCWRVLGGFVRAQAAIGLIDAFFIGLGLLILDVPLWLPLSVVIFFAAFIPIVGAVVSGALAALVALVSGGPIDALIVIGLVLVVQQIEGNLLQPILVGRTLDLHPVVVLLSVAAGATLQGITGAFLAVPVVSVLAVTVRYTREVLGDPYAQDPPEAKAKPSWIKQFFTRNRTAQPPRQLTSKN